MKKQTKNTPDDIQQSVGQIYANILKDRASEHNKRAEEKLAKKEADLIKEEADDEKPLTKKEKQERALESWKEIIVDLTGDDLDYIKPKKSKKKYKKWIDDEGDDNRILISKPKKKKKVNYNKEFESELTMLKSIVADQNRFTDNLQKRYNTMVGPNTKDAMPLNKTAVELASAVISSRSNSLALIKEIGNIKKTIADLYMKDKKLQSDLGAGGGFDQTDLTLLGSSVMSNMAGGSSPYGPAQPMMQQMNTLTTPINSNITAPNGMVFEDFNPDEFEPDGLEANPYTKYENIPKKTVVEYNQEENIHRYKTINTSTGQEINDYPNPTFQIKNIDVKNKVARDSFDSIYELEIKNAI